MSAEKTESFTTQVVRVSDICSRERATEKKFESRVRNCALCQSSPRLENIFTRMRFRPIYREVKD